MRGRACINGIEVTQVALRCRDFVNFNQSNLLTTLRTNLGLKGSNPLADRALLEKLVGNE